MCWADIQIYRQSTAIESDVAVSTSAIELVPYSRNRVSVIIGAPVANRITISTDPNVVDQKGIVLTSGGSPLSLTMQSHGAVVNQRLFAIANASTNTIGVIQSLLPEGYKP